MYTDKKCVHEHKLCTRTKNVCTNKNCVHEQKLCTRTKIVSTNKNCVHEQKLCTQTKIVYTKKNVYTDENCVHEQKLFTRTKIVYTDVNCVYDGGFTFVKQENNRTYKMLLGLKLTYWSQSVYFIQKLILNVRQLCSECHPCMHMKCLCSGENYRLKIWAIFWLVGKENYLKIILKGITCMMVYTVE